MTKKVSLLLLWFPGNDVCLVPPIVLTDDVEEFSDVEDQINDNDIR